MSEKRTSSVAIGSRDQQPRRPLAEPCNLEALLAGFSASLADMEPNRVDTAFEQALRLIGECVSADEVRLLSVKGCSISGRIAYSWALGGAQTELACSSRDFVDRFPAAMEQLNLGEPLIFGAPGELPEQAHAERTYLSSIGLLAAIAQPIMVDGDLIALLFVHRFAETRWPATFVDKLPSIAGQFGNALARKQAQTESDRQLAFEAMLVDISARFVNPAPETIDAAMDGTLARIGTFFQADRVFVARFTDALTGSAGSLTYAWVAPHVATDDPLVGGASFDQRFPWMTARMRRGEVFRVSPDVMPPEAVAERDYVRRAGIQSSILIPLTVGGCIGGVTILDSFDPKRHWTRLQTQRLQLIGEIIASALERKLDQAVLHERGELLRATLERAPAGVALTDPRGNLVQANPSFCRMLGYDRSELRGRNVRDLTHPDDLYVTERALAAVVEKGMEAVPHEKRYIRKDGSPLWAQVVVSGIRDAEQGLRYLVGVVIDVSQRKAMEQELKHALAQVRDLKDRLEAENLLLREEIELKQSHEEITGESAAMRRIKAQIERVAPTDATVLILGETGTGKELAATAVHRLGKRANKPLIKVNCAALPEALIEAELFGREKGAYTGALTRQIGRFELADGATLFLDEIGDLPLGLQSKLLRVLQEGQFERLGSARTLQVDVRLIAATNRDLEQMVRDGSFREDLFYRLNVFPIEVPPLRERPEDIPALVWDLVGQCCERTGQTIQTIPARNMQALQTYAWPGNVRELYNQIERALILTQSPTLRVELPGTRQDSAPPPAAESLEAVERAHIAAVLARTGWRIRGELGAASILGLKPTTLEYRIKKLGLKRPSGVASK